MKTSRSATRTMAALLLAGITLTSACTFGSRAPAVSREHRIDTPLPALAETSTDDAAARRRAGALLGKLPLYFIENRDQADREVAYYVQGRDTTVSFTPTGVTFALAGPTRGRSSAGSLASDGTAPARRSAWARTAERPTRERWAVRLDFVGANPVIPRGEERAPAVISYWKGGDGPSHRQLESYRSIVYPELWPGIDLVYSGDGGQLKYTFLVKPGADPGQIQLAYRGASAVTLTAAGGLVVSTPVRRFNDERPYAYQDGDRRRDEVPVAFDLRAPADGAQRFGFTVGAYDPSRVLVLDPSLLVYAGYVGGPGEDQANGIAVDAAGSIYVVGDTTSVTPLFPTKIGPDLSFGGGEFDAFVAKIKPDGSDLVYLGYIGGAADDFGSAIAVDKAGNAYVTGLTSSDETTFPVKVGPSLVFRGGDDDLDAFVAKVKADGTGLVYCGYIGGYENDDANGIAVDAAGNAYVVGETASDETTFPVKVGPGLTFGGATDAFIAKVKADGTALVYAGYIGGAGEDEATAIALDAAGNAYVTGSTKSDQTTFPVKVGPDLAFNGVTDAFVAKVKADGSSLIYLGYIGGASIDIGNAIAVDPAGNAYVTGVTASDQSKFPVKVGPDLVHNGDFDAFVAKVKSDGTTLVYAGYIGGVGDDSGRAITVDGAGNAYVAGSTRSDQSTFPVRQGPDVTFNGIEDAFLAKVRADGTGLIYAGYVGGAQIDFGLGIAIDAAGNVYLAGGTFSDQASFPVAVGPDLVHGGDEDAFVAKVSGRPDLTETGEAVSFTPSAAKPGGATTVFDGTVNIGLGSAKASTTRYYLSKDPLRSADDILLGGSRAVPVLQSAAGHIGSATVTVPTNTPPGSYRVLACADDLKANAENDETNNCSSSGSTLLVALPDLLVTSMSDPPASAKAGSQLQLADSTVNVAVVPAPASSTRYYLSVDGFKGTGDVLLGGRAVPALNSNTGSGGGTTVTIPGSTPAGLYRLLVCADDVNAVKESSEANNCLASSGTIQVTK